MDYDKAIELLKIEYPYNKDDPSIFAGMKVIAEHTEDHDIAAGHDIIWFADFEESIKTMSENTIEYLNKSGWFYDEENDCWAHFC